MCGGFLGSEIPEVLPPSADFDSGAPLRTPFFPVHTLKSAATGLVKFATVSAIPGTAGNPQIEFLTIKPVLVPVIDMNGRIG